MIQIDETKLREILLALEFGPNRADCRDYWNALTELREMLEQKPMEPVAWAGGIAEGVQLLFDKPTTWDDIPLYALENTK